MGISLKIYLIGYRCTGKTTVGRKLADFHCCRFIDTDDLVREKTGRTIARIVETSGWEKFREMEKDALKRSSEVSSAVISTGGGIILDPENRNLIKNNGYCVWLTADESIILQRLETDVHSVEGRPALSNRDLVDETRTMIQTRTPLYRQLHQLAVDTGIHTPDECVNLINRSIKNGRI